METHKKNGCREGYLLSTLSTKLILSSDSSPLQGKLLTLTLLLPALFLSCTQDTINIEETDERVISQIQIKGGDQLGHMDVFTFNDDHTMFLDSYQRVSGSSDINVRSQSGKKIIFICANLERNRYDWADISSLSSMDQVISDLRNERRDYPVMTGSAHAEAGYTEDCSIHMERLISEVAVNSICCDFSGSAYAGEKLKSVIVYLTNVSSRCSITAEGNIKATQIINAGGLNEDDIKEFREIDLVYRKLEKDIGSRRINTDIRFLCYPNTSDKEGPGTPYTRLVIEGEILGQRYWWPIDINRDGGGTGIDRNCQYSYDITLRRKGSDSPDRPVELEAMNIEMRIATWKDKEDYTVLF